MTETWLVIFRGGKYIAVPDKGQYGIIFYTKEAAERYAAACNEDRDANARDRA